MNRNRKSSLVPFLVLIIVILLAKEGWDFYRTHKNLFTTAQKPDVATIEQTPVKSPETPKPTVDAVVSSWSSYNSDSGFFLKIPSYVSVGPNIKTEKTNLSPTTLEFHDLALTPNPNADFLIFKSGLAVDAAKNFILDLGLRFVSYDPSTETWYVNSSDADKPSAGSHTYKNIYKKGNEFKPTLYSYTSQGTAIYGPFMIGDETRGTKTYLIPMPEKSIVLAFSVVYNNDALSGSTAAVKVLKKTFDIDFLHIIKSVTIAE